MKTYKFTTYNALKEKVQLYNIDAYNLKEVRNYAKQIVANSRNNEIKHGRITLL